MDINFAVLILTHGRPHNIKTTDTLRRCGYTGKIYYIIDDEDKSAEEYKKEFGEHVIVFNKNKADALFDCGDKSDDKRAVVYARNAVWGIAESLALTHFIELDDDYCGFYFRADEKNVVGNWHINDLDSLFLSFFKFLDKSNLTCIAMSQGGDYIGGVNSAVKKGWSRKVMNVFFCRTDRQFQFDGRINEDLTASVLLQHSARAKFLTIMRAQCLQTQTQLNPGGLTDIYKSMGTYVKSFYSVMFCPSAVKISTIKSNTKEKKGYARIHHKVNWDACAPLFLSEKHKKQTRGQK